PAGRHRNQRGGAVHDDAGAALAARSGHGCRLVGRRCRGGGNPGGAALGAAHSEHPAIRDGRPDDPRRAHSAAQRRAALAGLGEPRRRGLRRAGPLVARTSRAPFADLRRRPAHLPRHPSGLCRVRGSRRRAGAALHRHRPGRAGCAAARPRLQAAGAARPALAATPPTRRTKIVTDSTVSTKAASHDTASNITAPTAPPSDGRIEQLREWLEQRYPDAELDEDSDLTDGVVEDSLAFVELLVLVEDLRGTPIPAADVDLENFRTLRIIAARFFDAAAEGDGQ